MPPHRTLASAAAQAYQYDRSPKKGIFETIAHWMTPTAQAHESAAGWLGGAKIVILTSPMARDDASVFCMTLIAGFSKKHARRIDFPRPIEALP